MDSVTDTSPVPGTESGLIVLTCASGRQCSQIIPLLYEGRSSASSSPDPHAKLRLVVHSETSRARLAEQYPAAQVVRADLQVARECAAVVAGADTVFYVGPPFHPYEVTMGMNMVDAVVAESRHRRRRWQKQQQKEQEEEAEQEGKREVDLYLASVHFIFSSALHPEASKLLHHDQKRQVEEYLGESGLAYTVLQPSIFMDNFLGQLLSQQQQKQKDPVTFTAPFNPAVPMSFTALRDHAEVAVKVVRERARHFFATYQLVSTRPMTTAAYADAVVAVLGRRVDIKRLPLEQAADAFVRMTWGSPAASDDDDDDVDQTYRDAPERMLLYYNSRGLLGNPGVLEWLLGREPTTPADLARLRLQEAGHAD
ncbi:hypothetical protein AYL99_03111 [Fonsecaea erecta]|uniref:NmrA-like domain-containing protein n=1 Tax=Fonsecaea erecta TaxID=1367422 RepID=A0A178ZVQ7_9EURO|nr:hypothetical protein AYL99_03111 [Fonsecaea erecta]OAP63884.1 hypothetical protein AYL99_03111 [Fonsecaea erecta]